MKRLLVLGILLSALCSLSASWYIGGEVGYNHSFVSSATRFPSTEMKGFSGLDLSFIAGYELTDCISFESGIRYSMKNMHYSKEDVDNLTVMHNFLELPLSVSFSFGSDRVRGFVGGGGYIGIRFLQAVAGRTMLGSESLENMTSVPNSSYVFTFIDFNSGDNLFDAGLLAEAGIGYTLGSGELLISARYQYSFTSLDRKYQKNQVHRYIDTLSITAGYSFSLGDKK